jgi:hypothetical protein
MLDIKALQGFGSDLAIMITAFLGLALQLLGGGSDEAAAVYPVKVLKCRARKQAPVINAHKAQSGPGRVRSPPSCGPVFHLVPGLSEKRL